MGADHLGLGTTPVATVDLGTLATDIARLHGGRALRILFLPAGGTHVVAGGKGYEVVPYYDADTKAFFAGIGLSPADLPKDAWTLVPLEPIRKEMDIKGIDKLAPMTRFLLLGFEYLVTTPDAKPATPLSATPPPS